MKRRVDFWPVRGSSGGVNDLSAATSKRLGYVSGFLQLGLLAQARRELAGVPEAERAAPGVLAMQLEVAMAAESWTVARRLARRLRREAPGLDAGWLHGAFAERRAKKAGGLGAARAILEAAEPRLGARSAVLHYNLACYLAQLGELEAARARLARAVAMEPAFAQMAKKDEDLIPLGLS